MLCFGDHLLPCQLPPAIRPGLHCGNVVAVLHGHGLRTSPGHQAGAPLRRRAARHTGDGPHNFPRPSGRGSIAARGRGPCRGRRRQLPPAIRPGLHCGRSTSASRCPLSPSFPRPSGRGSIAAAGSSGTSPPRRALPPAIRPGLHCGGAARSFVDFVGGDLPPAIRPGLHCGAAANGEDSIYGGFPRPSGRGSIAATTARTTTRWGVSASPGHQAGAPLRHPSAGQSSSTPTHFPRPSGRGSIAAPGFRPKPAGSRRFPRPSGRGSIAV